MPEKKRKLVAIVYTDIAGFSELSASDENRAIELVNIQRKIIQPIIESYNGTLHKEIGDGFLLTFPTVSAAVEFGIDFQRAVKKYDELKIRIGIHEGEVTVQDNDIFGDDVNVGARIEPYSPIGGIAVSEKVKLEIGSLPEYQTKFIGEPELKGISQPIKIYCIASHGLPHSKTKSPDLKLIDHKHGFRFNILNVTGLLLTVIGAAFWIWYGLGGFTQADEDILSLGIKKSIAVLAFENLSEKKEGDYFCSGLSENLRSALTKLGQLDVKSRLASLSLKNTSEKVEDLDYFVEGSLSSMGDEQLINIGLVSAQTGNNVWTDQFTFINDDVNAFQDSIYFNILAALGIKPSAFNTNEMKSKFENSHTFQLLGEGIYHFDNKNYQNALMVFDSILNVEPNNLIAQFHKANTQYKMEKYPEALKLYQSILTQSEKLSHIQWSWHLPVRNSFNSTTYNDHIAISPENNLAIIFIKGADNGLLFALDLKTQKILWENYVPDKWIEKLTVNNDLIFLTSVRTSKIQQGEPTLFAFNINTGGSVFEKEFSKENDNQVVSFEIVEDYYSHNDDNSSTLLFFNIWERNADNKKRLTLINNQSGVIQWSTEVNIQTFDAQRVNMRTIENEKWIEILLSGKGKDDFNKVILINNKSGIQKDYWGSKLSDECRLDYWEQNIISRNCDENKITLWSPMDQKKLWQYNSDDKILSITILNGEDDMQPLILTNLENESLNALNYEGGFFNWNLLHWSLPISKPQRMNISPNKNRLYCLTKSDTLFTINLQKGKIINRLPMDRHDYKLYSDGTESSLILVNSQYIMGIDPLNGNQLWKIKDVNIPSSSIHYDIPKKVTLIDNSVFVTKISPKDSSLIINNYDRNNGNLIGSEIITISSSMINWSYFSGKTITSSWAINNIKFQFELREVNGALLLLLPDKLIQMSIRFENEDLIDKKQIQLQTAHSFAKSNKLIKAIHEYQILIDKYDQMNQTAYWELAEIYQNTNNVKKAITALKNYYDLILPSSQEGIKTIQKLKQISGLRWEKNIYWDDWETATIAVDGELIFRFLQNWVEAYRISSGALIFKMYLDDSSTILLNDVKNKKSIFTIEHNKPNEETLFDDGDTIDVELFVQNNKFNILSINKNSGDIKWRSPLNIDGGSSIKWMRSYTDKIYIQHIYENNLTLSAFDISNGLNIWDVTREISDLYSSYQLEPAFYKNYILLPLDDKIEYLNIQSGNLEGEFADENIEQIYFFNEHSVQNNTILFAIEDIEYEYYVVDIEDKLKVDGGEFEIETPGLKQFGDISFYDITNEGIVVAYNSYLDTINPVSIKWRKEFQSNHFLAGIDAETLYVLNANNNNLYKLNPQNGSVLDTIPLIWSANKIKIVNEFIAVQSANKLYVLSNKGD